MIVGHKAKMLVATRTYDSAGTPHPLAPLVYMRYSKVKILVFYASKLMKVKMVNISIEIWTKGGIA